MKLNHAKPLKPPNKPSIDTICITTISTLDLLVQQDLSPGIANVTTDCSCQIECSPQTCIKKHKHDCLLLIKDLHPLKRQIFCSLSEVK